MGLFGLFEHEGLGWLCIGLVDLRGLFLFFEHVKLGGLQSRGGREFGA